MHMCAFNYRFVPAVRLARQMIESGRARRDPPLPRPLPAGVGRRPTRRPGASRRTGRARARSATSARTSIDLARYLVGEIATVSARQARSCPAGRSTTRSRPPSEFENGAVGTIEATRFAHGPEERLQLGDQRLEGLARVRPRAAERAPGQRGQRRVPHAARLRGRPPVLELVVAARPHDRLGAHLRARAPPPPRRDRRRRDVAPHGATFEDGYRASEVCDAIVRSAETGRHQTVAYRSLGDR